MSVSNSCRFLLGFWQLKVAHVLQVGLILIFQSFHYSRAVVASNSRELPINLKGLHLGPDRSIFSLTLDTLAVVSSPDRQMAAVCSLILFISCYKFVISSVTWFFKFSSRILEFSVTHRDGIFFY